MKILCVTHNFDRAGAQFSLLRLMRYLHHTYGVSFAVISLDVGKLLPEYKEIAPVRILGVENPNGAATIEDWISSFLEDNDFHPSLILANTVVSPQMFPDVSKLNIPIITRVAELESGIRTNSEPEWIDNLCRYSSAVVGVSKSVCDMLIDTLGVDKNIVHRIHGAIEAPLKLNAPARKELLQRYGIPLNVPILWGCGSINKRKGADLFLLAATRLLEMGYANFHAVWIGDKGGDIDSWIVPGFNARGIHFVGPMTQPSALMSPQDLFLLTSREDPFPLAALEAGSRGLPLLGFEDSGGMAEVIKATGGLLAPNGDSKALAENVATFLDQPERALHAGSRAKQLICEEFTIEHVGKQWMTLFTDMAKTIPSAVEPHKEWNTARLFQKKAYSPLITGIVRTIGERTGGLCKSLLSSALPGAKVAVVQEKPFSKALREGFLKGMEADCEWVFTLDADVLLCETFITDTLRILEKAPENLFGFQGLVCDKFFGIVRPAGNHIFRTSMLYEALSCIPEEGMSLRPESDTIQAMVRRGYAYWQKPLLVGLHDYEQYYNDIAKKCFLQAHKHTEYLPLDDWKKWGTADPDFQVAYESALAGIAYTDQILVDADFLAHKTAAIVEQFVEKSPLSLSSFSMSAVQQEMLRFVPEAMRSPLQKRMFPKERWDVNHA